MPKLNKESYQAKNEKAIEAITESINSPSSYILVKTKTNNINLMDNTKLESEIKSLEKQVKHLKEILKSKKQEIATLNERIKTLRNK